MDGSLRTKVLQVLGTFLKRETAVSLLVVDRELVVDEDS